MRRIGFMAGALAVSACASLSGLGTFSSGPGQDASVDEALPSLEAGALADALLIGDDVVDGPTDDGWTLPDESSAGDAAPADPGDAPANADAHAPCSSATCSGCCDTAGVCHGGASASSCGVNAQRCVACPSGKVCSSGACATSGGPPPSCTTSSCHNGCIPVWQGSCCRSDGSCGCQVLIPPGACQ
jgi:hypothetical protein